MKESEQGEANNPGEVAELLNRGVESLALLLELVSLLKAKGILTDGEVGDLGKRAEQRRVEILQGIVPS